MDNRSELVTSRVTERELQRIELAAAHRGESRSSFLREAADRVAREELARVLEDEQRRSDPAAEWDAARTQGSGRQGK